LQPKKCGYILKLQYKGGSNVKAIYTTALVLIVIGGINWGLVGFFDYNLVDSLFGVGSALARIVYGLVGLAAIYVAAMAAMKPAPAPAMKSM
jgi:uncharacterized membrane protein YuzA (DUF378 family)